MLVKNIIGTQEVQEEDVKTVQQIILNRQNFDLECSTWCCEHVREKFFCCLPPNKEFKSVRYFEKAKKQITLDLDLRTYMKHIRHVQILEKVLLTEKQRNLMNF